MGGINHFLSDLASYNNKYSIKKIRQKIAHGLSLNNIQN